MKSALERTFFNFHIDLKDGHGTILQPRTLQNYANSLTLHLMQLNVLLFGITKEIVGQQKLRLQMPEPATVPQLLEKLHQDYPKLKELQSLMVAVNNEYGLAEQSLHESDEIALIPPVSGG